jgi:hypothetical protein
MKVLSDEKKGETSPYTVPKYPHFLAVWTMFDSFYFRGASMRLQNFQHFGHFQNDCQNTA